MGGLFLGFACGLLYLWLLGRLKARHGPAGWAAVVCWLLVVLTGLDTLNAILSDGNLPHLYPPNTAARLLTGLGAGYAIAALAVPVIVGVLWRRAGDEPVIGDSIELAGGLALPLLLAALIWSGVDVLLWPLGLAMVASVLAAFGSGNLYLLALLGALKQDPGAAEVRGALLASLGGAIAEIAALAALRDWLVSTLHFTWGS